MKPGMNKLQIMLAEKIIGKNQLLLNSALNATRSTTINLNTKNADQGWETVSELIKRGARNRSIETGLNTGISVLWMAAYCKRWDIVQALLDQDANVNAVAMDERSPHQGKSVLWWTAFHQEWDLSLALAEKGAKNSTAIKDPHKDVSVIQLLNSSEQVEIIKLLKD